MDKCQSPRLAGRNEEDMHVETANLIYEWQQVDDGFGIGSVLIQATEVLAGRADVQQVHLSWPWDFAPLRVPSCRSVFIQHCAAYSSL